MRRDKAPVVAVIMIMRRLNTIPVDRPARRGQKKNSSTFPNFAGINLSVGPTGGRQSKPAENASPGLSEFGIGRFQKKSQSFAFSAFKFFSYHRAAFEMNNQSQT
jgi:hypothetical protein